MCRVKTMAWSGQQAQPGLRMNRETSLVTPSWVGVVFRKTRSQRLVSGARGPPRCWRGNRPGALSLSRDASTSPCWPCGYRAVGLRGHPPCSAPPPPSCARAGVETPV